MQIKWLEAMIIRKLYKMAKKYSIEARITENKLVVSMEI